MRNLSLVGLIICLSFNIVLADEPRRTANISAQSEIKVKPDEAILSFSIVTKNEKLIAAKIENDKLTSALVKVVKDQSISSNQFRVTSLRMGGEFGRDRIFLHNEVTRAYELTIKDFSKINSIVSTIVDAGGDAITIQGLDLMVSDQRKYQTEARRIAVELAREKAEHLAKLNFAKIGKVISIDENVETSPYTGGQGGMGGFSGAMSPTVPSSIDRVANKNSPPSQQNPIRLTSMQNRPNDKPSEGQKDDPLHSAGLVSLNATVHIVFELIPN